jgi:hypothetical protein
LLDASYVEQEGAREWEVGSIVGATLVAIVSLMFWKPVGFIGTGGLLAAAWVFRHSHPERTLRFHEFRLVLQTGPLLNGEVPPATWHIEYGWIESISWDGDRLNLWLS